LKLMKTARRVRGRKRRWKRESKREGGVKKKTTGATNLDITGVGGHTKKGELLAAPRSRITRTVKKKREGNEKGNEVDRLPLAQRKKRGG